MTPGLQTINRINRKNGSGLVRGYQGVTLRQPEAAELEIDPGNEPF